MHRVTFCRMQSNMLCRSVRIHNPLLSGRYVTSTEPPRPGFVQNLGSNLCTQIRLFILAKNYIFSFSFKFHTMDCRRSKFKAQYHDKVHVPTVCRLHATVRSVRATAVQIKSQRNSVIVFNLILTSKVFGCFTPRGNIHPSAQDQNNYKTLKCGVHIDTLTGFSATISQGHKWFLIHQFLVWLGANVPFQHIFEHNNGCCSGVESRSLWLWFQQKHLFLISWCKQADE